MPQTIVTEGLEITGRSGGAKPPSSGGGGGDDGAAGGSATIPQRVYVTGMTIGMGAILMFFMALVSAFIVRKGVGNDWRAFALPNILWLNTLILLASSATIVRARSFLAKDDRQGFHHWWAVTTVLGLFFLAGQLIAWRQMVAAGLYVATNPSSSFFYVLTAAHGLHLLGGILALIYVGWLRLRKLTLSTAAEVASLYWHFLDGLWVFLFLILLLGR
ncbi:MAG TPA: heme-copper oxidase subunit III [Candidatus Acidoferrales bacterium]|nr:heme-copper oxidase subunit III [Candidatus Acidoferrales bacterium]